MDLSSKVLAQIIMMQSVASKLDDEISIMSFICRGFSDIPGIRRVLYVPYKTDFSNSKDYYTIDIAHKSSKHYILNVEFDDYKEAEPYIPYIENFCTVIGVILEEKKQRLLKESLLHNLEERVLLRTKELEEEVKKRELSEKKLKTARLYISSIIDSMPSILIGFDKNFNITQINKEAQKRLEVDSESALGKNLYQVIPKTDSIVRLVEEAIKTNRTQVFHKSVSGNGSIKVCEDITVYPLISSKLEGAVLRIDDITDRVKIEESAIQNEKMLSIGGLAAGMAHEINNPLAGVIQMSEVLYNRLYKKLEIPVNKEIALKYNLDLLSMKKFMEERGIPKMFNSIHESGEQISYIVSNMLSFARKGDAKISTHYIDKIVDETITLAQTDYDIKSQFDFKKIKIIKQYRDDVPPLSCDKTKIQQVILNILRNGAQEMQKSGTEDPHFIISFRENNGSIELEIQDNGPGMDEETKKRIFEPFFTTKGSGFGTGLGLSISYYIIHDNHKGELIVDSEKGHGAKFTIKLPIQSS